MHYGRDDTFAPGDRVSLANGSEGVVVRQVWDNGFTGHIVRITRSTDPSQLGMTIGATPMYMDKIALALPQGIISCSVVDTPAACARGLQGHPALGPGEGMLFLFAKEASHAFHMGTVHFPIDIVFFASDGRVTKVVEAAQPGSCEMWSARSAMVLELAAGGWQRHAAPYDVLRGITGDPPVRMPAGPQSLPVDSPGGDVHGPDFSFMNGEQFEQPYEQGAGDMTPDRSPAMGPASRYQHHDLVDALHTEAPSLGRWESTMGRDPSRDADEGESSGGNRMSAAREGLIVRLDNGVERLMSWPEVEAWRKAGRITHVETLSGVPVSVRHLGQYTPPDRSRIVNPSAFATALVDAIREGAALVWKVDALNAGATESAHIDASLIRRWFQRIGVNDFGGAMEAALSSQGLDIIGDTFVLAGMADMARVDKDRQGLTLSRRAQG